MINKENPSAITLLPDGSDVALLVGFLDDNDPQPQAILRVSLDSIQKYDAEHREMWDRLSKFNSWQDAIEVAKDYDGSELDLIFMSDHGILIRLPGMYSTPDELMDQFRNLILVTLTAGAIRGRDRGVVFLAIPDDPEGVIPISESLFQVIIRSSGGEAIPDAIRAVSGDDADTWEALVLEFAAGLAHMVRTSTVAVLNASPQSWLTRFVRALSR